MTSDPFPNPHHHESGVQWMELGLGCVEPHNVKTQVIHRAGQVHPHPW